MNIFERAARAKLRFDSTVGLLTVEDLFDLPLTSRGSNPDLDKVARVVNAELRSITEDSFVETKPDPRKTELALKLEIAKHVIAIKQAQAAAAENAATRAARRERLLEVLASKETEELKGMTREQIAAELASLGEPAAVAAEPA